MSAPGSIAELELGVVADVVAVDLDRERARLALASVETEVDARLGDVVEVVDLAVLGGAQAARAARGR